MMRCESNELVFCGARRQPKRIRFSLPSTNFTQRTRGLSYKKSAVRNIDRE